MTESQLRRKQNFFLEPTEMFTFDFGDEEDNGVAAVEEPDLSKPEDDGQKQELLVDVDGEGDGEGDDAPPAVDLAAKREAQRETLKAKIPTAEEVEAAFEACLGIGDHFLNVPRKDLANCRKVHQAAVHRLAVSIQQDHKAKQRAIRKKEREKRARETEG